MTRELDATTLDALARMGCDEAQGYSFSPALAADAFEAWCVERALGVKPSADVA